jgi:hypothetical protein
MAKDTSVTRLRLGILDQHHTRRGVYVPPSSYSKYDFQYRSMEQERRMKCH